MIRQWTSIALGVAGGIVPMMIGYDVATKHCVSLKTPELQAGCLVVNGLAMIVLSTLTCFFLSELPLLPTERRPLKNPFV